MPKLTKIEEPVKKGRGRPKGSKNKKSSVQKMYTFNCGKGCTVKFITPNAEGQCSVHRLPLELKR